MEITNKKDLLNAINKDGCALKYASKELLKDKDIILKAVKNNGLALQYADDFKFDLEIIYEALKENEFSFSYVPVSIRNEYANDSRIFIEKYKHNNKKNDSFLNKFKSLFNK